MSVYHALLNADSILVSSGRFVYRSQFNIGAEARSFDAFCPEKPPGALAMLWTTGELGFGSIDVPVPWVGTWVTGTGGEPDTVSWEAAASIGREFSYDTAVLGRVVARVDFVMGSMRTSVTAITPPSFWPGL